MENIINEEGIEKFRKEVTLFNSLNSNKPSPPSSMTEIKLTDYLQWVQTKKLEQLIDKLKG